MLYFARLLLFSFVLWFPSAALLAQTAPHRQFKTDVLGASTQQKQRVTRRFLGWKFAARAQQDTTTWVRPELRSAPASMAGWPGAVRSTGSHSADTSDLGAVWAGFVAPSTLPTGYLPTAVVQGDFNEDGKQDLAISNGGDNTVYVLLGKGDGTFGVPEVLYTSGQSPVSMVAVKLRTGGHFDLIVVDGDSNQAEVFPGNGDGTFQPPSVLATFAQSPSYITVGDFNNDGQVDLAIGLVIEDGYSSSPFEVLFGDGTGAFPSSLAAPPLENTSGGALPNVPLVAADLNNDGYLDLVTGFGYTYLSNHGASFRQIGQFGPADGLVSFAVGDMNGDGCADVVQTGSLGLLTIADGTCDGNFTEGNPTAEAGDTDPTITLVDVDGDGNLDVVAAGAFFDDGTQGPGIGAISGYLVSVLKGDGKGSLAPAAVYRAGPDNFALGTADLNGDGRPEIIALSQTESHGVLLVNDGSGGFGPASGETIGYVGGVTNAPSPVATPQVVDLNGDGKPDVLLVEYGSLGAVPSQLTSLLNDGTGKLGQPIRSAITVGPTNPYPVFVAGPFRSTQAADVVYVSTYSSGVVGFFPGKGDGTFGAPVTLTTLGDPLLVTSGDFNSDGKLDFAVYSGSTTDANTNTIDVFLGDGTGNFRHLPPVTFTPLSSLAPQQLIAGDFNHDGKLDLLIGYNDNGGLTTMGDDLDLALGNGDGSFQAPTTLLAHFGPVAVGDLNHDGYLDLLQARDPNQDATMEALNGAEIAVVAAAGTVYLGQPAGGFAKQATYLVPEVQTPSFLPALLGDFNGDGNLDFAIPYLSYLGIPWERRLAIFSGNGDGTFAASGTPYQLPGYDQPVIGGDFRGTGRTDLLDLVGSTSAIDTIPAGSPAAVAIVFNASPLGGPSGTATVSLAQPSAEMQTIALGASDPAVHLPSSLSISAGSTQQSFSFEIGSGFDRTYLLALSATVSGYTATAYAAFANSNLTAPGVTAFINLPLYGNTAAAAVSPGSSTALILSLKSQNGYSGIFQQLSCTGLPAGASCVFVQPSITLAPGGSADTAFSIVASPDTTPGNYSVQVIASNGAISPSAQLNLGVGDFTFTISPATILVNAASAPSTTVSTNFVDGYANTVNFTCIGLPVSVSCQAGVTYLENPQTSVQFDVNAPSLAASDYPFVISGAAGNVTHTASAVLRVTNYTAQLNQTSATLAPGKSATFQVTLTSQNHFTNSSIEVLCQYTAAASCAANPAAATLADGGKTTVTLTITASVASATANMRDTRPSSMRWSHQAPWLALLILPFGWRRRRWYGVRLALCLLALACGVNACGGSAPSNTGGVSGGTGGGGTTSQSVTIQVYGSAPVAGASYLQNNAGTINLTITN